MNFKFRAIKLIALVSIFLLASGCKSFKTSEQSNVRADVDKLKLELRESVEFLILKNSTVTVLERDEKTIAEDKCYIPRSAFPAKLKTAIDTKRSLQDLGFLTNYFVSFSEPILETTVAGYANSGKPCPFQEGWAKFINIVPHVGMDHSPILEESASDTNTSAQNNTSTKSGTTSTASTSNKVSQAVTKASAPGVDPDYSSTFGELLASNSTKVTAARGKCGPDSNGNQNWHRGDCYECAANAIDKSFRELYKSNGNSGRGITWDFPELNTCAHARDFADGWQNSVHSKKMHLKKVWDRALHGGNGMSAAMKAPRGSIIVWGICGREEMCKATGQMGIGHIGIVTQTGGKEICSSLCAELTQFCANPNAHLVAVFQPIK